MTFAQRALIALVVITFVTGQIMAIAQGGTVKDGAIASALSIISVGVSVLVGVWVISGRSGVSELFDEVFEI